MTWSDAQWSETDQDETADNARWQTPPEVFDPLHREFGFGLDAAAMGDSARVPFYLGPDHINPARRDSFAADWLACRHPGGGAVWLNPPYGRGMGRWMVLAARWGRVVPVVVLILSRTDLPWWHSVVMTSAAEVRFVRGRVHFLTGPEGERASGAPAPSLVVVWRPGHSGSPAFSTFEQAPRPRRRR
jgi:site-specific DNA-methyltransferase (adenine-specific)